MNICKWFFNTKVLLYFIVAALAIKMIKLLINYILMQLPSSSVMTLRGTCAVMDATSPCTGTCSPCATENK